MANSNIKNNISTQSNLDRRGYHCFEMPTRSYNDTNHWYFRWYSQFKTELELLTEQETEKLAGLIPLLLCGEQSAIVTFHQHANQFSKGAINTSAKLFSQIESELISFNSVILFSI